MIETVKPSRTLNEILDSLEAFDEEHTNYHFDGWALTEEAKTKRKILVAEFDEWWRRFHTGEDVPRGF